MTAVAWHLLRGLGAVALVAAALLPSAGPFWAAILLLPAAALLLRGCPMCWLLGLAERVRALLGPRSKRTENLFKAVSRNLSRRLALLRHTAATGKHPARLESGRGHGT